MGAARRAWNAAEHPRGPGGKFASKGSAGGRTGPTAAASPFHGVKHVTGGKPAKPFTPKNSNAPHAPFPVKVAGYKRENAWAGADAHGRQSAAVSRPAKRAPRVNKPAPKAPKNAPARESGTSASGVDLSTVRGMGIFSSDPDVRAAALANVRAERAQHDTNMNKLAAAGKVGKAPSEAEVRERGVEGLRTTRGQRVGAGDRDGLRAIAERGKFLDAPKTAPGDAGTAGRHAGYDSMNEGELDSVLHAVFIRTDGMTIADKRAALAEHDRRMGTKRFSADALQSRPSGSAERTEVSASWKRERRKTARGLMS